MTPYRHIFFDLDHTLWDFARNSEETLRELHAELNLEGMGAGPPEDFLNRYYAHNHYCWSRYRAGLMTKEQVRVDRFTYTLFDFGVADKKLAFILADEYVARSPHKPHLLPHAMDTLHYLHEKYHLHLITNGFEEVQITKIKVSGIGQFFREVITSEKAGALKPDPRIFRYALDATGAVLTESIYIGDNLEADIIGARKAGWPQVYFNPDGLPHQEVITHEIRSLKELQTIF